MTAIPVTVDEWINIVGLCMFVGGVCGLIGYVIGNTAPTTRAYRKGARDAYATMAEQARQQIVRDRNTANIPEYSEHDTFTITPTVIP